ncbi:MAG: ATP-dependent sacrificial sulfur transferase LarE [Chloroflexota bacterium]
MKIQVELHEHTQTKLDDLRGFMHQFDSVIVAYSGGVDSALVMAVAHEQLGENALACIGVSPSYPQREMQDAVKLADEWGIPYRLVNTEEYLDENYAANPTNRCYFCKSELHNHLKRIVAEENWAIVLDGTNASDQGDHRPGIDAAREREARSPLAELGITKPEIRAIARSMNLPVWDKPAMACLSSRVPHGTAITPDLLRQIETAEDVLVAAGFTQFRVRHHNDIARIEIPPEEFPQAIEHHTTIVNGIKETGYRFVTLDLSGFRSGSLNGASMPATTIISLDEIQIA